MDDVTGYALLCSRDPLLIEAVEVSAAALDVELRVAGAPEGFTLGGHDALWDRWRMGEIARLIETASNNVNQGVGLVHDSGQALREIVAGVEDVAQKIAEIVTASQETATGITEISNATTELDRTTQQNAAVFEETNAAVRSLQGEATALAEAVATFQLQREESWAPRAPEVEEPRPALFVSRRSA